MPISTSEVRFFMTRSRICHKSLAAVTCWRGHEQ